MNFELFENDVVARLAAGFAANAEVEKEPETEAGYKTPTLKPRVSVMYDESDFEKQTSTQFVQQHETCKCNIIVRARKLRGIGGIYDTCEKVRQYIVGYAPTNWSKIWLLKVSFVERKENLWTYNVMISSKSMIVEEATLEVGPAYPPFNNGTAVYTDGQYN